VPQIVGFILGSAAGADGRAASWLVNHSCWPAAQQDVRRPAKPKRVVVLLLKNLLFTAVVPGTVAIYVPLLIVRDRLASSGVSLVVSIGLLLLGAAMYFWCVWDFAAFGRGTPAPIDAPKKLVVRGLYHYTRNPMYVGVLAILLGWMVLFKAPGLLIYTLCVGLGFHLFVVFYEEPHLQKLFGSSYEEYRARVGRWLPAIGRPTRCWRVS